MRHVALLLIVLAAPQMARAESAPDAARRVSDSLLRQLASSKSPHPAVAAVAVAPLKGIGAGAAEASAAFHDALEAALGSSQKLKVRAWSDLDRVKREKALQAALGGDLGLPPLSEVQALIVGEATSADGAPVRIQLRLLVLPTGSVLATESAWVEAAAATPPSVAAATQAASVDVAIRRLSDQLAAGFRRLPGNARYERLAVLVFSETGAESKKRELGTVVSAELATNLRRDHGLLLVERTRLKEVLGEMQLGAMGLVPEKDAPRLGKLADAQALIIGSVSDAGDRFLVNARIVSTETAESLATANESVSASTLVALSSEAVVLRSRQDAVFRSLVLPGWGQAYNRQPAKAAVFAGAAAVALGGAIAFHLAGASAEHSYKTQTTAAQLGPDPVGTAVSLRNRAERDYTIRNGFIWALAGIWTVNVLDAYTFGVDGGKLAGQVGVAPTADRGAAVMLAGRF
jgi:TolB-like protein